MSRINYYKAVLLINNKLSISQMIEQGFQAYVYPQPTIDYACKVLCGRELKLYLQICGQANGFRGAMKFYSDKSNVNTKNYPKILESLEKKGFIKHIAYESIEVLFPTEENNINTLAKSQNGKNETLTGISKNGKTQENENISQFGEIKSNFGNEKSNFGNNFSKSCGYNREIENRIEINKETLSQDEKDALEELGYAVKGIAELYNNESKLIKQIKELKQKGFSYEFIFRGIENKGYEYFENGFNLLFYEPYQKEVLKIYEDYKKEEIGEREEILKEIQELI